ncbi:DSD1 family PLP-dependent enzyme [Novosphingobium sp. 1949]|uniref:DSD1 family PLP-dependent enzyme n=1 Tax=Novosphingobium organovorum TaxID=2930092 RepID=A0ABT0BHV2_9SPHN|nr:DSD1 family PLP-dependent enzyme [Novosphingobium organovorum]MCJ2184500.1 DSD1 family PLP-dependent enzyme [Novosphingobium organovorum]
MPCPPLATPALLLDLDRFERNLARMAAHAHAAGVALRPHAKTHKCAEIARAQIAAGAVGLCCAKLGEAEALADAGLDGLLVTSPQVTPDAFARLIALSARAAGTRAVCDDPRIAKAMGAAAQAARAELAVLVDLDVGQGRSGCASVEDALALARRIAATPGLRLEGIQAYAGHAMHITGSAARRAELERVARRVAGLRDALTAIGLAPGIVTGGGTGSFGIDAGLGVFTELQVGSYVFMDREYDDIWTEAGESAPFEPALTLLATVTSANHPSHCTIDAGCKALATDAGLPRVIAGAPAGTRYAFFGDEQGRLIYPEGITRALAPGDRVVLQPAHCDPTVNLHDTLHAVRGGALAASWPITARGRCR